MKTYLSLALVIIVLSSCVSNKKYAELEAEVERLQATEAVLASVNAKKKEDHDPRQMEIDELNRQLEDMAKMLKQVEQRAEMTSRQLTPEELAALDMERQRAFDLEMMKTHQEEGKEKESDALLAEAERQVGLVEQAAKAAMERYDGNEVMVERNGTYVVITVKNNTLYSTDGKSVSTSGESFTNRLKPVLELARGMNLYVVGISENAEGRTEAASKAVLVDTELAKSSTYQTFDATVGAQTCDNARSQRNGGCNKVEFVFAANLEEAMQMKRTGR